MVPGPDQIIACPQCEHLARYRTLMSGNNSGAHFWTDGRRVAPMLPHPPAVVKCRRCAAVYWLTDATKVGQIEHRWSDLERKDLAWKEVEEVEEPTESEYYDALDAGFATDLDKERKLRILAWWRRNDFWRRWTRGLIGEMATDDIRWRSNLERLFAILDENDDDGKLKKAEILRELGEFDQAMDWLRRVESRELDSVVRQFMALCEYRDPIVRKLRSSK